MRFWLLLALLPAASAPAPRPSLEQVLSAHRARLCGAVCDSWSELVALGTAEVRVLSGGRGLVNGEMSLESRADHFDLKFRSTLPDYPGEHFSFDGKEVRVDFLTPGKRSPFGDFVFVREQLLKQGLLGGTLNRRWPLLDPERERQIRYRGWKKKQKLHELEYRSRKGSSLQIRIYLNEEWTHVRTSYTLEISAQIGATPEASARMDRTYVKFTESFDDFDRVDGLLVPRAWEMEYSHTGTNQGSLWKWSHTLSRVSTNLSKTAP